MTLENAVFRIADVLLKDIQGQPDEDIPRQQGLGKVYMLSPSMSPSQFIDVFTNSEAL